MNAAPWHSEHRTRYGSLTIPHPNGHTETITEAGIAYTVRHTATGSVFWTLNGILHREHGPAVRHIEGAEYWHRYGQLHRDDGPAILGAMPALDCPGSVRYQAWYRHGERITTPQP